MLATLKTNLNRTVLLERDGDRGIVIKRFHSPGALRRLTDGRRAAREFRVLSQLHELGLPVPPPIEVRKRNDYWEVLLQWIPGAHPIEDFLGGKREKPAAAGDLARGLASLLARAWTAGLVHSDLHAGNVLLDEAGELWLIDFQHARFRSKVKARRMLSDLVSLAAGVRESCSQQFRARFLIELLKRLPSEERDALGARSPLARDIEDKARNHHRYRVHRREMRWTRESGACRSYQTGSVSGWIARDFEDADATYLNDLALLEFGETATVLGSGFELLELERDDKTWLLVRGQDEAILREAWYASVRIQDHGLPAPSPILYVEAPEPRMLLLDRSASSSGLKAVATPAPVSDSTLLRNVMHLIGSLHDRGLVLADFSDETFRFQGGSPSFGAPIEVVASNAARRARDREAVLELLATRNGEDTQWQEAYCSAWRGDRSELVDLREELARD